MRHFLLRIRHTAVEISIHLAMKKTLTSLIGVTDLHLTQLSNTVLHTILTVVTEVQLDCTVTTTKIQQMRMANNGLLLTVATIQQTILLILTLLLLHRVILIPTSIQRSLWELDLRVLTRLIKTLKLFGQIQIKCT